MNAPKEAPDVIVVSIASVNDNILNVSFKSIPTIEEWRALRENIVGYYRFSQTELQEFKQPEPVQQESPEE